jgi:hypothetical protein
MKSNSRWLVVLALISGACWIGAADGVAASGDEAQRAKDAAWKPTCDEVGLIQIGDRRSPGALKNFCLNAEGNILACFGPNPTGDAADPKRAPGVRVYSPQGALLNTLPLEIRPGAICVAKDGSIFVAGDGQVLKLDAAGKVLARAASPVADIPVSITKEIVEMLAQSGRPIGQEIESMKTSLEKRRAVVTGLAATGQDVFMAVPTPNEFTYRVYRFDHALQNPTLVVDKLRGCCGQMDIQAHDGNLWIPHNARHQVESHDRDGEQLAKFGKSGKVKASDFGGCCEPKNMRVLPNGEILAAESGPPTCIKRFSADGRFLEVVAVVPEASGDCVRVTVDASPDGKRYYLLDTTRDAILIFGTKG